MSSDTTQRDVDDSPSPDGGEPPHRLKKTLWITVAVVILAALGFVVHLRIAGNHGGFRPPGLGRGGFGPLAVGVAQATVGDVPITIDSLGTVTPLATVTVHPQVTGPLVSIPFTEGQMVKAGQLLAQIDPRPFQAAVDQAMGQLEHDQALLANARVDLDRYKMLMETNSVAEQTYATQQATVLQDEATVVGDKAALETAKLNLGYTHITSPVTGRVGLRQVDNGNVVSAYSSSIVVVTQLQPMSVLFTIPEDNLEQVLQRLQHGAKLSAVAYDRTFTTKLDSGVLANSDNEVDTSTGTLKLRAMFNNSAYELFPDQFVNIRLTLDTLHDQVLIPGAAVQTGPSGSFVYVVDQPDNSAAIDPPAPAPGAPADAAPGQGSGTAGYARHRRGGQFAAGGAQGSGAARFGGFSAGGLAGPVRVVHVRYVKTGPTVGNLISIASGLKPGETVVVDGAEQLRDGASVTTPNATQPPSAAGPPDDVAGQAGTAAAAGAAPAGAEQGAYGSGAGGGRRFAPGAAGQHRPRPAAGAAPGGAAAP